MINFPTPETNGLHIFEATKQVRHNDGRTGRVVEHSTTQACVEWTDGTVETIEQHDEEIWVCRHEQW